MTRCLPAMLVGLALALGAEARDSDPPMSIYRLEAALTDQSGAARGLDLHRGHPVLITMFYGGCTVTCPLIIDSLRATERALGEAERANLRVLLVSIDPKGDTPEKLRALAESRRIDTSRWTLARADEATVRNIAALLNVQYRELPSGEFNHSTTIALLSAQGEIEASTASLGSPSAELLAKLRR
jgi:protein SCO1